MEMKMETEKCEKKGREGKMKEGRSCFLEKNLSQQLFKQHGN